MIGGWLTTFVAALVACAVAMLALGLGVLLGREPLGGSCGGGCDDCVGRSCDASVLAGRAEGEST